MNSAPSAPADSLLTGVGVTAAAVTGCSRVRALSASSAPVGFCAGGIANCAEAFGSASPLQLARMEEFYVWGRLSTNSVHSLLQLRRPNWRGGTSTSCREPFRCVCTSPHALDASLASRAPLLSFACSSIKGRKWDYKRVLGIGGVSLPGLGVRRRSASTRLHVASLAYCTATEPSRLCRVTVAFPSPSTCTMAPTMNSESMDPTDLC